MKLIPLTQGQFAMVDDWNYEWLMQWKWHAHKSKKNESFYAIRSKRINGKRYRIAMHREIMKTPIGMQTDHRDHNGLNCLEENLRNCTKGQNAKNRKPWGRSRYLGVHYIGIRIVAAIRINKKQIYLGDFKTEEDAARAYDIAAKKYHGEFANLNYPNE